MKLSIIVPVYNVQPTLERCIVSIATQSFTDWEAILVDDGSPDECPAMCDEWHKRDKRFTVIHKENGGLSDARNAGLERAKGEYVTFVDSDDYLSTDTYEKLCGQLEKHPEYDILEYSFCKEASNGTATNVILPEQTFQDARTYWLEAEAYLHCYAWNKVYRHGLFNGTRFPEGLLFEDVYTLPRLLAKARVVATTTTAGYHYTENPEGITAKAKGLEWQSLLGAQLSAVAKLHLFEPWPQPAATKLYIHLLNIQLYTYCLNGQPPSLPYMAIARIPQQATLAERIKVMLLKMIGINKLCRLYKITSRWTGK